MTQEYKPETLPKRSKKVTPVSEITLQSKSSPSPSAIKKIEKTEKSKVPVSARVTKPLPSKSDIATTETKKTAKKVAPETINLKAKTAIEKTISRKAQLKSKKLAAAVSVSNGKSNSKKAEHPAVPARVEKIEKKPVPSEKKVITAVEPTFNEAKILAFVKRSKKQGKNISAEISSKKVGQNPEKVEKDVKLFAEITQATAEIKNKKISVKENKTAEIIEMEITPSPVKPKNKKAKPLSAAVFRGKKNKYDFEVFDLNELFEPIPAVYVISKRITDKKKKGHHTLVCIGETISLAEDIKRHRKSKCLRKTDANVISILKEDDEQKRAKIETDLKAAHSIQCNLK